MINRIKNTEPELGAFSKRIAIIDDTPGIRTLLRKYLEQNGYTVETAASGLEGIKLVQLFRPDVIFLDINMPGMSGLEVQSELNRLGIRTPIIIITGFSSMQTAVFTIRSGAYDYITKPFKLDHVGKILSRCFDDLALEESTASASVSETTSAKFEIIGLSDSMVEVYKAIASVSKTNPIHSVLIYGETGTGKELVARQIHHWSDAARAPFEAMNVAALPDNLIESELFGHEKGAFTGATQRHIGRLELAGNGTLLLDEIGDISRPFQHKLLRVLQEREFYRLGGSTAIPLKARVIAATNRDLTQLIATGAFREDLYYRLNVISICIPPLRLRRDDIPILAQHFIQKHAINSNKPIPTLSEEALECLTSYTWPGNVRQLENLLLRTLASTQSRTITARDLALEPIPSREPVISPFEVTNLAEGRRLAIEKFEQDFLSKSLDLAEGDVAKAATNAGVNRESFYRLMRKYGIKPKG